jgi:hypothetical protein
MTTEKNMKMLLDLATKDDKIKIRLNSIELPGLAYILHDDEVDITKIEKAIETIKSQKLYSIKLDRKNSNDSKIHIDLSEDDSEEISCTNLLNESTCFVCSYYQTDSCIVKQYAESKDGDQK